MSQPPPAYSEPLLEPESGPRTENDNLPDDFKWSDVVAECAVDIRHRFMQRVYTILVAQLAITVAISAVIIGNTGVRMWAMANPWAMFVALFGAMGTMLLAMWKRRSFPLNLVFLGLFTVLEGYVVGVISSTYDTRVVVDTLVVTAVIFAGLSVVALQTKYDLTSWVPYLGAALFGLIGFGFVAMFFPSSSVELAYSFIAVTIFSGYILVDTQLILTKFHPDDEVAAAISLYLDIINLFLNLLRILNGHDDN